MIYERIGLATGVGSIFEYMRLQVGIWLNHWHCKNNDQANTIAIGNPRNPEFESVCLRRR